LQPSPILDLRRVAKTYHTGEVDVPVLHDVNLNVVRGELLVIVGPSGSGKSTLLNLIGGIDRPTAGEVWFSGRNLTTFSERELTRYRRVNVGFVFQLYNLVPTLTARENVLVSTEISDDPLPAEQALELVELGQRLEHFPAQLSGGEQQRVAIARAVAKNPELLLCDEPTGSLDLETGRTVLEMLGRLNGQLGKTVLIITHNSAIAGIAHRVVRLGSGTIADVAVNAHPLAAREICW
jgi:putative ABC transport system ATP-binding protein